MLLNNELRRLELGHAQLLQLGLRGVEELEIASGSVGGGGCCNDLGVVCKLLELISVLLLFFAEGHLVAVGDLRLQVMLALHLPIR